MPVIVDRETLALDLRTYGEGELAQRMTALDDETLARIHDRADHYLYGEANGLVAKAVSLAAIEVLEGAHREPRWKRRKLKGIWPEQPPESVRRGEPVDRREVEQAIALALNQAGYQKASGEQGAFVKPVTDDVKGRVGYFIQRLNSGELEVTPTVGVRHERIPELIDRLERRKGSSGEPTATIILGYLLPENNPALVWRFDGETPSDEVAESVAKYIVEYGEPWMRKRSSPEGIVEAVRSLAASRPELLPAALFVGGRQRAARETLDAALAELGDRTDAAADDFRRFAERFEAEVLSPPTRSH